MNNEAQARCEARKDRAQYRSSAPNDLQEPRRQDETRRTVDLGHSSDGPSWIDLAENRVTITESRFAVGLNRLLQQNRLTMEVQDGDQLKIGSSVIDVAFPIEPDWSPSHRTGDTTPVGYAPTVDLAEKGMLFLTFQTLARNGEQQREYNRQVACTFDDVGCLPFAAYRKSGDFTKAAVEKAQLAEVLRQGGPRDVPFASLPRLVRFRDINDPTTRVLV